LSKKSKGVDEDTRENVAVKLEPRADQASILQQEVQLYSMLASAAGIPHVVWSGGECDFNILVLQLLGPSLRDLFEFCGRRFSLKTVLMLADQLICRLKLLHSKDIVHCDIKPGNFLMGTGRTGNQVYVTDFGIATNYRSPRRRVVLDPEIAAMFPYTEDDSDDDVSEKRPDEDHLTGTAQYASIRGHFSMRPTPRDDMESLGYMLIEFLLGSLPWSNLSGPEDGIEARLILERKDSIATEELCQGVPKEFKQFFDHVRSLSHHDIPKYEWLRQNFDALFRRCNYAYDNVFDWTIISFFLENTEEINRLRQAKRGSASDVHGNRPRPVRKSKALGRVPKKETS